MPRIVTHLVKSGYNFIVANDKLYGGADEALPIAA
jgi:hypothetical protein